MKLLPVISVLLLSVALCVSCGPDRRVDAVLSAADSLVFAAPDSAVALLESLDASRGSDDQTDRHALLLAKAREKAYVTVSDATPDSLLSRSIASLARAVRHFRGRGDSLEVQTLFYRGVLLGYRGDYSDALVSLMEAADRAADTDDHFYRAMASREQSAIYSSLYAYDQSAHLGQEAVEAFNLAGRPYHAAWSNVFLPQSLVYSGRTDEARDLIGKLMSDSLMMSDKALHRNLYDIAFNVSLECNDIALAEKYFEAYAGEGGVASSKQLSGMVSLKIKQGDIVGAKRYYDLALTARNNASDSAAADWAFVELARAQGNYKEALDRQTSLDNITNQATNRLITHPYTALLIDYYHEETLNKQLQLDEAEAENLIMILLVGLILSLAVLIVVLYRHRLKRKDLEREVLINDIVNLKRIISDEKEKLKTSNNSSFAINLLNDIVESASPLLTVNNGEARFGKNTKEIIMSLGNSSKQQGLETIVNNSNNMAMERFRCLPIGFSDAECSVALFVFLGFSNSSIATILQRKPESVRQIRCRIRNKLRACDLDDCNSLLRYF